MLSKLPMKLFPYRSVESMSQDDAEEAKANWDKQVILCTTLSSSNKINAKNVWEFSLIDAMGENLVRPDENMEEIGEDNAPLPQIAAKFRTNFSKNLPNFQKAAHVLDAASKIFSTRVDDTYSKTTRFQFGLQDMDGSRIGGGDAGDDADSAATKQRKNAAKRSGKNMLETNPDNLIKAPDLAPAVDPLYERAVATIDQGGALGSLMDTLFLADGMKIIFDSHDRMPSLECNAYKQDDRTPDIRRRFEDLERHTNLSPLFAMLRGLTRPRDLMDLPLCPDLQQIQGQREFLQNNKQKIVEDEDIERLSNFQVTTDYSQMGYGAALAADSHEQDEEWSSDSLNNTQVAAQASVDALLSSAAQAVVSVMKQEQGYAPQPVMAPLVAEAYSAMGDADEYGDDYNPYDDDDNDGAHAYHESTAESVPVPTYMPSIAKGVLLENDPLLQARAQARLASVQVRKREQESLSTLEGDEVVTLEHLSLHPTAWAGAVPRMRRVQPSTSTAADTEVRRGKRKARDSVRLPFLERLAAEQPASKPAARASALNLSRPQQEEQWERRDSLLLPDDEHYTPEALQTTFARSHLLVPLRPAPVAALRSSGRPRNALFAGQWRLSVMNAVPEEPDESAQLVFANTGVGAGAGAGMGAGEAHDEWDEYDDGEDGMGDYGDGDAGLGMDMGGEEVKEELPLIEEVMRVEAPIVNFAQRQRTFNIRRVKREIFTALTTHAHDRIVLGDTSLGSRSRRSLDGADVLTLPSALPHVPKEAAECEQRALQSGKPLVDEGTGLPKKQRLLGGNEGVVVATDFRTLVETMGAQEVKDKDGKSSFNPVPGCFIGLLLLANEKNLELRAAVAKEDHTTGTNTSAGDVGFDLSNFYIYTPASN